MGAADEVIVEVALRTEQKLFRPRHEFEVQVLGQRISDQGKQARQHVELELGPCAQGTDRLGSRGSDESARDGIPALGLVPKVGSTHAVSLVAPGPDVADRQVGPVKVFPDDADQEVAVSILGCVEDRRAGRVLARLPQLTEELGSADSVGVSAPLFRALHQLQLGRQDFLGGDEAWVFVVDIDNDAAGETITIHGLGNVAVEQARCARQIQHEGGCHDLFDLPLHLSTWAIGLAGNTLVEQLLHAGVQGGEVLVNVAELPEQGLSLFAGHKLQAARALEVIDPEAGRRVQLLARVVVPEDGAFEYRMDVLEHLGLARPGRRDVQEEQVQRLG